MYPRITEIAHDLNNMFSVVIWNLEHLSDSPGEKSRDCIRLRIAMDGARGCAKIMQELVDIANQTGEGSRYTDLKDIFSAPMEHLLSPLNQEQACNDDTPWEML
jgi:hypothetical protein